MYVACACFALCIFTLYPYDCVCHRAFQEDLQSRLQQWSAQQCVGDVFVKLCSKLQVYTNYFNNHATALDTIDKVIHIHCISLFIIKYVVSVDLYSRCCHLQCREMKPSFRAFLKRTDRTLATHMLRLVHLNDCLFRT